MKPFDTHTHIMSERFDEDRETLLAELFGNTLISGLIEIGTEPGDLEAVKDLAEQYINFMLSDDAAIANAEYIYYASPHANVYNSEIYKEDMGEDAIAILYPEGFNFHENYDANCYKDLPADIKDYINTLWSKFATE